jgi:hypothetical protein
VRIPGERAAYLDPDRSLKITAGQIAPSACCCARLRNLTAGSRRPTAVTRPFETLASKRSFADMGKLRVNRIIRPCDVWGSFAKRVEN